MIQKNIFEGGTTKSELAKTSYKMLLKGDWISYSMIFKEHFGKKENEPLHKEKGYGQLKKVFPELCRLLEEKEKGCIETRGNKRNMEFRYVGSDNKPLSELTNASIVKNLEEYWEFVQDSSGFFPISWLNFFFKDTMDLLKIKNTKSKGKEVISSSSLNKELKNIDKLPEIYKYIKDKKVIKLTFQPFLKEKETLIVHPHILRENNGRWHLYAYVQGEKENGEKFEKEAYNIALDRIEGEIEEYPGEKYRASTINYSDRFKKIIGATYFEKEKEEDIIIRAYGKDIFMLNTTKKMHNSQYVICDYDETKGYGDFHLRLVPNKEFYAQILHFGEGLEIISPDTIRQEIKKKIAKMCKLYNTNN